MPPQPRMSPRAMRIVMAQMKHRINRQKPLKALGKNLDDLKIQLNDLKLSMDRRFTESDHMHALAEKKMESFTNAVGARIWQLQVNWHRLLAGTGAAWFAYARYEAYTGKSKQPIPPSSPPAAQITINIPPHSTLTEAASVEVPPPDAPPAVPTHTSSP